MENLVVAFVADLMFQMRIESAVEKLDMQVHWLESAEHIISSDYVGVTDLGSDIILLDQLKRLNPKLLIFDLGNRSIPWGIWIPVLKKSPSTRQIPVICFGSHVDVDALKKARLTGADEVLARSRFVTSLPKLIQKYAG